jgi:hypothetical protein
MQPNQPGLSCTPTATKNTTTHYVVSDPDLAALVTAWPELPEAIKAGIMAMVMGAAGKSVRSRKKDRMFSAGLLYQLLEVRLLGLQAIMVGCGSLRCPACENTTPDQPPHGHSPRGRAHNHASLRFAQGNPAGGLITTRHSSSRRSPRHTTTCPRPQRDSTCRETDFPARHARTWRSALARTLKLEPSGAFRLAS